MTECTFTLNRQQFSRLVCTAGGFTAFSGQGQYRNNPEAADVVSGGPIPPGLYHIVDRKSGGFLGQLKEFVLGRDRWFALYADDGSVDDQMFIHSVRRGEFRLHPLGPRGISTGCVVLQYSAEFDRLSNLLRGSGLKYDASVGIRTYGRLEVDELEPPMLEPQFRPGYDPGRALT